VSCDRCRVLIEGVAYEAEVQLRAVGPGVSVGAGRVQKLYCEACAELLKRFLVTVRRAGEKRGPRPGETLFSRAS
jgi:NMD protein affecting ribosome stability and mRNA decay